MKKFLLSAALVFTMTSVNCGYSTRSLLPSDIKTIHVAPFKNKVNFASEDKRSLYLPLLEVNVRNAIVDRYLFDGNLKIVDPEISDLTLTGELVGFERSELRLTDNDDVQEYRIFIIINMSLKDNRKDEVLWEEANFSGEGTYFVTGPQAKPESSAIQDALVDLARRVVERTIEDW